MALDEDSLEAMLRRQRSAEDEHSPQPTRLIEGTDEFEVYEREPVQQPITQPVPEPVRDAAPEYVAPQPAAPAPPTAPEPVAPAPEPVAAPPMAPPEYVAPQPAAPAPEPVAAPPVVPPEPVAPEPVAAPPVAAPVAPPAPVMRRPGNKCRVAIVQSDYHRQITDQMSAWAAQETDQLGGEVTHHLHVPGAYDLPLVCQQLLAQDDVDAVVAIGCIIQGETAHDEVIAYATAQNLQALGMQAGKPVGFAVSGPRMNQEQAEARIVMGRNAARSVVAQWRALRTV